MSIDLIPDLKRYPHIYGAHKDGKLIIFVGAGLSALLGCKRWKDMAISLLDECYIQGHINYWMREVFLARYSSSPRKLITIARNILGEKYLECLKSTLQLSPERKSKFPKMFEHLRALNAIFMTTNVDDHFSGLFSQEHVHSHPDQFATSLIKPGHLFHLHGVIHTPNTLVLTIDEYIARYQYPAMQKFLEYAFLEGDYRLLFLGYGVDEMEIIDYMIEKYSGTQKTLVSFLNRLYVLLPFFPTEEPLLKYEESYFQQINMNVIPYAIDVSGYDQLYQVLEKWTEELTKKDAQDHFYQFTDIIERNA